MLEGFRPPNAGILAGVALEHGLRGVALHHSAVDVLGIEVPATQGGPLPSRWLHDGLDAYTAVPEGIAPWVTLAERDQRAPRKLWLGFVTDNESLEAFAGLPDGPALQRALASFQRHFGISFYSSPGRTGKILVRDTIGGLRPGRSALAPPAHDRAVREAPFSWSRPLTPEELEDGYVVGYDVNGQYLAAMSSLRLSAGMPTRLDAPTFDRHTPGYWLARLPERPAPGSPAALRPDPFRPVLHSRRAEPADGFVWLTTPTVEFLAERGHPVEIREAWVWVQSRRFLDGFYERCRDARTALLQATSPEDQAAYRAVKLVYTKTLGHFESERFNVEGGELYRPEWHHTVIAKARANLSRKLARLTRAPFAVDVDALYFTSPDPDPERAAAQLGLTLSSQLGAFKVIGAAPLAVLEGIELGARRAALKVRDVVEDAGEHAGEPGPGGEG